jgi:hypothetical protein
MHYVLCDCTAAVLAITAVPRRHAVEGIFNTQNQKQKKQKKQKIKKTKKQKQKTKTKNKTKKQTNHAPVESIREHKYKSKTEQACCNTRADNLKLPRCLANSRFGAW